MDPMNSAQEPLTAPVLVLKTPKHKHTPLSAVSKQILNVNNKKC